MKTLISIQRNTPIDGETLLVFGLGDPLIIPATFNENKEEVTPAQKRFTNIQNVLLRSTQHDGTETDAELEKIARKLMEPVVSE